jgi:hypothetical protein
MANWKLEITGRHIFSLALKKMTEKVAAAIFHSTQIARDAENRKILPIPAKTAGARNQRGR